MELRKRILEEQVKRKLSNNMNNKVIKVLGMEHGKRVIKFWKQYCDTGNLKGTLFDYYYGIIDGDFDVWRIDEIRKKNAEIIELHYKKRVINK